ncbi:hypothetical protein SteCoe_23960 [Stentor coeruleus]|uniref:Uncharacterized protein n=1 Tax=Stentor coeruleus TaxID=5963 RepID=A0A1R2BIN7_9CILI|nr:hypothetical protein SteCoe_23960 [Stentor coeruleus]
MSPINSSRFPSISEYPEAILRKSEELPKYMSNEFIHVGHKNSVNSIALLQGRIFTAGHDYKIIFRPRLDSKKQINLIKINPHSIQRAHSRRINALETLGCRILISAGCQHKIFIWSLSRDLELASIIGPQEQNTNALLATSQKTLILAGSEGIIKIWDIESRILSKYYYGHDKSFNSIVQIHPSVFLSGSDDCTIKLYDLRTSKSLCTYMHNGSVTSLISWDDKSFFSASEKLRKWELRSSHVVNLYKSDEISAMEKVKGKLVTGGKFLTVWEDDVPGIIKTKNCRINRMKYNFLNESLYLGCSDSSVIALKFTYC